MKERPIIFNNSDILAILDNRKTMTRRVVKPQPLEDAMWYRFHPWEEGITAYNPNEFGLYRGLRGQRAGEWVFRKALRCPYGVPGDRLYAKTGWRVTGWHEDGDVWIEYKDGGKGHVTPEDAEKADYDFYNTFDYNDWHEGIAIKLTDMYEAAGGVFDEGEWGWKWPEGKTFPKESWRSAMFLPKFARRMTCEIKAVKVGRVQDISEEDAVAEGVRCWICGGRVDGTSQEECACFHTTRNARPSFEVAWDVLNAKPKPIRRNGEIVAYQSFPWEDIRETREHRGKPHHVYGNPRVWALTFKRIGEHHANQSKESG